MRVCWLSGRDLRDGGSAGGGPLLEDAVLPVFCGLIDAILTGGADGGGGGGGLLRRSVETSSVASSATASAAELAFFDSIYCLMNSAFCSIWSSVMPISKSSPSKPRHDGSTPSSDDPLSRLGLGGTGPVGSLRGTADCACGGGCGTFGAEEERCPCSKLPRPPNRLWWDFPFVRLPVGCKLLP